MPGDARFGGFQCSQRSRTLLLEGVGQALSSGGAILPG
jgi:hypothetical protein